jgi:uncharacterized membrane protein
MMYWLMMGVIAVQTYEALTGEVRVAQYVTVVALAITIVVQQLHIRDLRNAPTR